MDNRSTNPSKLPTIVLPFIDQSLNSRINKIFKEEGILCNVNFKTIKLYNLTQSQTKSLLPTTLLDKAGVVYYLKCLICNEDSDMEYIGETSRLLKERLKEHMNANSKSEVSKHIREKHILSTINDWEIRILAHEKDNLKRKILEAFYISKLNPKINNSKGMHVIDMKNLVYYIEKTN